MEQQKLNIDFSKYKNIRCANCESIFWKKVFIMKEITGVIVGQTQIAPREIIICECCQKVHPSFEQFMKEPVNPHESESKIFDPVSE